MRTWKEYKLRASKQQGGEMEMLKPRVWSGITAALQTRAVQINEANLINSHSEEPKGKESRKEAYARAPLSEPHRTERKRPPAPLCDDMWAELLPPKGSKLTYSRTQSLHTIKSPSTQAQLLAQSKSWTLLWAKPEQQERESKTQEESSPRVIWVIWKNKTRASLIKELHPSLR